MCGIVGLISVDKDSESHFGNFKLATDALQHRGPDSHDALIAPPVALGHTRLSVIDTDRRSDQPMTDKSGRYTIIFNGEIYNYKSLKQDYETQGYSFVTESDTEVLLAGFILQGKKCFDKLNGFFAVSIFDRSTNTITIVRDRFGIKPLVYFLAEKTIGFASEMKALYELGFETQIDRVSVFTYFKLNYIPAPSTILQNFHKLEPGHLLEVKIGMKSLEVEKSQWYKIAYDESSEKDLSAHDYQQSQKVLKRFVRESVRRRLVSDVPIGTFLSGGIDSSIISAIAKEEKNDIDSFSIGFPDQPYYTESKFAAGVAKHLGINSHLIQIREKDLLESADSFLNHIDEPFADSSILNVNLLSKAVKQHVTVALSGDGGDELFAGYNKHQAEFLIRHPRLKEHAVGRLGPLWDLIPSSRSGALPNLTRQLQKFSDGYKLNNRDRYWRWAGFMTEEKANYLMKEEMLFREHRLSDQGFTYKKRKDYLLNNITKTGSLNEVLLTDMRLVLPNDMLFKVDYGSMMNGLEVRTPLLDHHIVNFAFKLPIMFKVNHDQKKKILQDSFRDILPPDVFNRPKKGFEVPLLEWFKGEFKEQLLELVNDKELIEHQGIFNPSALKENAKTLYSNNPGDAASWAWSFTVFQTWYKRHIL
jgi:asparagine synthase (glutamine-hydrolysing)